VIYLAMKEYETFFISVFIHTLTYLYTRA